MGNMNKNLLSSVPFTSVDIQDTFWKRRMDVHQQTTIKTCLKKCEETGRISNFSKAAGVVEGNFEGIFFNDSDVYKVLEGAAYSLMNNPNAELEAKIDEIIDKIASAQEEDGYLLTYYTLGHSNEKWTDMSMHEMYCGGHLIEAAVAYKKATGKDKLLKVACKLADHYDSKFGPEKSHWVPGHEEIELALVKLYHETEEERYLKLAQWLLDERGHGYGKGYIWNQEGWGPSYCQDDKPINQMEKVTGHAVRAMYLYTGVTDVAALTDNKGYINALEKLWENVVLKNMYLTGGIGPSKHNEGFTEDYDLPNDTAYCETCASVGMVMWNHRMNLLHSHGKYADIMERAMYNGAISGVSLDGTKFFYVNPLASDGNHHRQEWYDCSCCPTQIARFIPSIGNYVYNVSNDEVWINLYIASDSIVTVKEEKVKLTQVTSYPWDGKVNINVKPSKNFTFGINLRLPEWCKNFSININGKLTNELIIEDGYIKLYRTWKTGDVITFELDMSVERIYANPNVKQNTGKVALQRGPLVYCFEHIDNNVDINEIYISRKAKFLVQYREDLFGGVSVIRVVNPDSKEILTAVPYYTWDNREPGAMQVWVNEKQDDVDSLYKIV